LDHHHAVVLGGLSELKAAMNFLHDKAVLVLGLGDSGLAMARWCVRFGARVTAWDSRVSPPQGDVLATELPQVQRDMALPAHASSFQLILKSPGLAPSDERIAALLTDAQQTGVAVMGELDLFAHALAELKAAHGYSPKVLAITGTNGKTTVTALTALLVARAGKSVVAAGNIGPTLLDSLTAELNQHAALWEAAQLAVTAHRAEAEVEAEVEAAAEAQAQAQAAEVKTETDIETATETELASDESLVEPPPVEGLIEPLGEAPDATTGPLADDEPVEATLEWAADAASTAAAAAAIAPVTRPEAPPPTPAEVFAGAMPQVWVLELSSFQLAGGGAGVKGFEPSAATVLNVSQDHLDWHGDMAAYGAAKARVFGNSALMVINRDDAAVQAMVPAPVVSKPAKSEGKARFAKAPKPVARDVMGFGLSAPTRPGDFGVVTENGMAWLVRALPADQTYKRKKDEEEEIHLQRLMPADALRIRGRHNAANALAALALATAAGCTLAPMLHGLREYSGEAHRLQFVSTVQGVDAFDDSKGTNVGATVAAIVGLGADKTPSRLVVILGGDGKGQDFAPLGAPLAQHGRAVATIGRDAGLIEAALFRAAPQLNVQRFENLEAAVAWGFAQAHAGDALLLSPACASTDIFLNYKHRAEVFVAAVHAFAVQRGQV
jgi:UDP-N-acetylmuramoylalanine--D-glutamate ligase